MSETTLNKLKASSNLSDVHCTECLDIDEPNFTLTKRLSFKWKAIHFVFHLLFSISYTSFPIVYVIIQYEQPPTLLLLMYIVGSICKVVYAFMEWWHFKRGCCGDSNLNSKVKTNIDQSCKAKLIRMKVGLLYFIILVISTIITVNFVLWCIVKDEIVNDTLYDVFMYGMIGSTVVQVMKNERIVQPTKQYQIKNDMSNLLVEWFMFIGYFVYSIGLIWRLGDSNGDLFFNVGNINGYFEIGGGVFFMLSTFAMGYRYFLSDDADLNLQGELYISVV